MLFGIFSSDGMVAFLIGGAIGVVPGFSAVFHAGKKKWSSVGEKVFESAAVGVATGVVPGTLAYALISSTTRGESWEGGDFLCAGIVVAALCGLVGAIAAFVGDVLVEMPGG